MSARPHEPAGRAPVWRAALLLANAAARCGAMTRAGTPCRAPAMKNGRCHKHGGASTGPRTAEGIAAIRAAQWKHGARGKAAADARRSARATLEDIAQLVVELNASAR